jgi:hypothetical protein
MAHEVEVEIQGLEGVEDLEDAEVRIRIEDVSQADAPARTITERVVRGDVLMPGEPLHASLGVPEAQFDPRAHYSVRVHVDTTGAGRVTPGDYVSTGSHPVLTFGRGARVVIPLRRVD